MALGGKTTQKTSKNHCFWGSPKIWRNHRLSGYRPNEIRVGSVSNFCHDLPIGILGNCSSVEMEESSMLRCEQQPTFVDIWGLALTCANPYLHDRGKLICTLQGFRKWLALWLTWTNGCPCPTLFIHNLLAILCDGRVANDLQRIAEWTWLAFHQLQPGPWFSNTLKLNPQKRISKTYGTISQILASAKQWGSN